MWYALKTKDAGKECAFSCEQHSLNSIMVEHPIRDTSKSATSTNSSKQPHTDARTHGQKRAHAKRARAQP